MPNLTRSALVPYTATQMFELVNNVDQYREFVPWCIDSKVLSVNGNDIEASLTVGKGALKKTFVTHNKLIKPDKIIMDLISGPFTHLHGEWDFIGINDQGCKVSLNIEFEYSSRLVAVTFAPIFNKVINALIDAFCKRADDCYQEKNHG